jgi:hypothetical protein
MNTSLSFILKNPTELLTADFDPGVNDNGPI